MPKTLSPLGELLARHTREGELYEKLPGDRVRCFACGHRCLIPPGFDGVCRVRFNEGGLLKVPHGYVGALQLDPIEKKPFFHALPGAKALSFGMLGCDYHCGYCFTGDTTVITESGRQAFSDVFDSCTRVRRLADADVGFPQGRITVAASGAARRVRAVFRHRYRGAMVTLTAGGARALRCTPDHRVYAARGGGATPSLLHAGEVRAGDRLAIPHTIGDARHREALRSDRPATSFRNELHDLVPVVSTEQQPFDGYVYNMEVEEEHSYLAGFFAVSNCQNWLTSQALRDPEVQPEAQEIGASGIVRLAQKYGARVVTSTYNEPLITSEWAVEVFREARAAGLVCSYVSNGNGTPEVLDYIRPWVSLYKVDLKSFRDRHYRELGGTLERVLWTIRALREMGFWLEIVTLTIPGFNDSDEELTDIARFLVSVSPDIPWHVTAFHKDYKMRDPDNTPVATLLRAAEIGAREGLRYVYAGNIPGRVNRWENTWCPGCGALLVERVGYRILQDRVSATGACPDCARAIAGFWSPEVKRPAETAGPGGPVSRHPAGSRD